MTPTIRHAMSRSVRRVLLRPWARPLGASAAVPESMAKPTDALTLMAEVHAVLDRVEDQTIYGGVIFLHAEEVGALPTPDQARVHSAALPRMDYFRAPFAWLARVMTRVVRKLAAPLTRRQEQFNLDLLEAVRRLEHRLEAQTTKCRDLQRRVAELEARLP